MAKKSRKKNNNLSIPIWRIIIAIILPPLSVVDRGINNFIIVLILTFLGYLPGIIASLIILNKK
jgi:uncharacterized membrane protein YqaE (UPF0057 family)